jgi:hypothetical protein
VSGQLRTTFTLYAALWFATLFGAVAGWLAGGAVSPERRAQGGLPLFATTIATNGRLLVVLALAAVLVGVVPAWRLPLDILVVALALLNTTAVGSAIGAGRGTVALSLPHLPLEWAALATGLALYLSARRGIPTTRVCLVTGASAAGLLVLAAAVEAWARELG